MALLASRLHARFLRAVRGLLVLGALTALPLGLGGAAGSGPATREYQLKAVFLLNFAQFVEWPAGSFADARTPFVIGVLGDDPFDTFLEEAVRGEVSQGHPIVVSRWRRVEDVGACQVLFISRSEAARLDQVLGALRGRPVLTVGDADNFARNGGMIGFVTENSRVRLTINVEASKAAALTISSKLLRPAEIVTPRRN